MTSDQQYFRPRTDPRIYEESLRRASYLVDNGYVKLSSGVTFEDVVEGLIESLERENRLSQLNNGEIK